MHPQPQETTDLNSQFYYYRLHFSKVPLNQIYTIYTFFVWFLLLKKIIKRFTHVVGHVSNSFLYIAEWYSILWPHQNLFIYSSVDAYKFHLLPIKLYENLFTNFCMHISFYFSLNNMLNISSKFLNIRNLIEITI